MRYRGRTFGEAELELIRGLIARHPSAHRLALSRLVSDCLQWRGADGRLKDAACRMAMLAMSRDGLIQLPERARPAGNSRKPWGERTLDGEPGAPIDGRVSELEGLRVSLVEGKAESRLWNELIDRYHYLGYKRQGGAQMRYLVRTSCGRIVACLGFSAAAWKARARDVWIGWSAESRERRLHLVVNNARFLILPWVKVPHLASKLLSLAARRLPREWEARYGYRPLLLETFVDQARFKGTCYRAANWMHVGETTGRGRYDTRHAAHGKSVKSVWIYPLDQRAQAKLAE